jgi:hypothetical protein
MTNVIAAAFTYRRALSVGLAARRMHGLAFVQHGFEHPAAVLCKLP